MAAKRNGLGKGLDSLIPNKTAGKSEKPSAKKSSDDSKKEDKTGEVMVKINSVEPNREQPRKDFDEDSLVELADSIIYLQILGRIVIIVIKPGFSDTYHFLMIGLGNNIFCF